MNDWCGDCREYHARGRHLDLYEVWREENNREDRSLVRARCAVVAAEAWAELDDVDSAEYAIVSGTPEIVNVALPGEDPIRVKVSGESVPEYTAEEL